MFLGLNCCDHYDTSSAFDILERDENDWLQPFRNGCTELSELLMAADVPTGIREGLKRQTTSLFRSLLESSGGKVDCRQHDFGINYTTNQNASLCASLLGISYSRQFGCFDPEEMRGALSKSKLFAELSKPDLPGTLEWSLRMMVLVPVGFPDNYLVRCYQKLRLTYANNGPESPVAAAVRFRCTTSRSNPLPLVAYHPTYSQETMLTR